MSCISDSRPRPGGREVSGSFPHCQFEEAQSQSVRVWVGVCLVICQMVIGSTLGHLQALKLEWLILRKAVSLPRGILSRSAFIKI